MKVKYPRTYHLPFSQGFTSDDKVLKSIEHFIGKEIVMTEKRDGENSTIAKEYTHARSLDSVDQPYRHWLKGLWSTIQFDIPDEWRICGENLYAKHSIHYTDLTTYFEVFSIWNENNMCLSWNDTEDWCKLLELTTVPVIWRGIFNENFLRNYKFDTEKQEGYVVRLADSFSYDDFDKSIAKFVRKNHIAIDSDHWMYKKIIPNILKK